MVCDSTATLGAVHRNLIGRGMGHSAKPVPAADVDVGSGGTPHIALVIGGLEGGGAERVMSDMANYWARKGWRVTLATWGGPEVRDFYLLAQSVTRIWLDVDSPNNSHLAKIRANMNRIMKLRRLLKKSRPTAILSFIDVSNVLTILAALGLGVRVVVSERTNPSLNHRVDPFWRTLRRVLYRMADQVVAQTSDAGQWIQRKCGVRVVVIPNFLRALPQLACKRESLIIAVGRLSKEKGIDILLNAFSRIAEDFESWRMVIIGDGAERSALLELRDQLFLTDRVELVGQVRDVENWMARSGLVVHSSRREGFPNVVLEAMGMGAAVICADCPSGPAELIQDGVNGRLVPVGDVERLVKVMSELMANPDLRDMLGREASKIRQRYAQSAIMERWEMCLLPCRLPGRGADSSG